MNRLIFVLLLGLFPGVIAAGDMIPVNEIGGVYPLGRRIEILEDATGKLTIAEILASEEIRRGFKKSSMATPGFGFTRSAWWIRFSILNDVRPDAEIFLEYDFAPTDNIELYSVESAGTTRKQGGDYYPFGLREFNFSTVVFTLTPAQGVNTYYMRVTTTSALIMDLHLFTRESLVAYTGGKQLWHGLFYGILLMMVFYNLFVYFVIRDRIYLLYVAYILASALFQFSLNGLAFQYLWPDSVWLANNAVTIFLAFNLLLAVLFSKSFLHIENYSPFLNRVLLLNLALAVVSLGLAFYSYYIAIKFETILIVFLLFSILVSGIVSYRRGQKEAKYFLMAWGLLLVGGILKSLHSNGIVQDNLVTSTSLQIGVAWEVTFLSLALADRLRVVREQMHQAQDETLLIQKRNSENLEEEIRKKTRELVIQKEKLEKRKRSIEKELYIALTIQQKLIPRSNPVNYIASFYKPVIDVGGDLYDFILFEDSPRIGIFICDVVGHGVQAALTTSVIKTLILQAGARKENPDDFLHYMNELICREYSFGFITMYYGIYNPVTRELVSASAGHLPPVLIRNEGLEKLVIARTYPIGIIPNESMADHGKYFLNDTVILPAGSKVLFYTDGLSECESLATGEVFEDRKMNEVLAANTGESCHMIVRNLYEAVVDFRGDSGFDDDICILCLDVN